MFLNNLGEPIAMAQFEAENLDSSAPLLIACPNSIEQSIPERWTGSIYSTRRIITELSSKLESKIQKFVEEKRIVVMKENEVTEVCMPDTSRIFITPFLWTKGKQEPKLIFLIKDKYVARICVDVLSNTLHPIILNSRLRKAIQEGIDIVNFNDSFAKGKNARDLKVQHTWLRLHLLMYIIRPKTIHGLYDTTPPKYITQCCSKPDMGPY